MIMTMTRARLCLLVAFAVCAGILCSMYQIGIAVAHADPVGAVTAPPQPVAVDILQSLIGYASVILAVGIALSAVVGAIAKLLHAIAARTASTRDDGWAADADAVHDKLDQGLGLLRDLIPGGATPAPAPSPAPSVTVSTVVKPVAALLAVLLFCACGARQRVAAGVTAGLDCEQGDLATIAKDGLALGTAALLGAISGSGHPDTAAIKLAFGSAQSDSLRCLTAAAFAALLAPATPAPGAPASAPLAVDATELRAAFTEVRAGWGVTSVRVAGQVL
jgi:hypothetical protein